MIKLKEIKIGNYVHKWKKYNEIMEVISINDNCIYLRSNENINDIIVGSEDELLPIEITEKNLIEFGFKKHANYFKKKINKYTIIVESTNNNYFSCKINKLVLPKMWLFDTVAFFKVKYLHELQNGVNLITKEDLK